MKRTAIIRISLSVRLLLAAFLLGPLPASAMQILEAADHAELEAVVSDHAVSRITLSGDRVARVIRGAAGFAVEHDKARGDLYLRPLEHETQTRKSVTLFIGTARGFTYRLLLRTAARDSAQILIRNAAAIPRTEGPVAGETRVGALVALVRAVARREVPPGYVVETLHDHGGGTVFRCSKPGEAGGLSRAYTRRTRIRGRPRNPRARNGARRRRPVAGFARNRSIGRTARRGGA